jgi:hypothetical protein
VGAVYTLWYWLLGERGQSKDFARSCSRYGHRFFSLSKQIGQRWHYSWWGGRPERGERSDGEVKGMILCGFKRK